METRKLWLTVLGELETEISSANFQTWFQRTDIISADDGHILVAVPTPITKERMEKIFKSQILDSLKRTGSDVKSLQFKVTQAQRKPESKDPMIAAPPPAKSARPISQSQTAAPLALGTQVTVSRPTPQLTPLNAEYTFDNFVVGSSNDLAHAASQAVASYPGQKYNPLFIYGGVGLGKTHLMQAIGNEIVRNDPNKRIRYVTSEQFTNEFIDSVKAKATKTFAEHYRSLDVLIVDDIQFLGNKEKTQEEFFHTFNTLHHSNKQIIMSSDKQPKDIPHLESRLRSRFEMGMVADVQRPDLETRAAITQSKAEANGMRLPLDLVEHFARHFQHNIRELEGNLTRLIAYCEVRGMEPSIAVAKELLGQSSVTPRKRTLTPKMIVEKTASYFSISMEDILSPKRDKEIVVPRQIAMYLIKSELDLSLPKVAAQLGRRDHTTAMHSIKKIERQMLADDELRSEINLIRQQIAA